MSLPKRFQMFSTPLGTHQFEDAYSHYLSANIV